MQEEGCTRAVEHRKSITKPQYIIINKPPRKRYFME